VENEAKDFGNGNLMLDEIVCGEELCIGLMSEAESMRALGLKEACTECLPDCIGINVCAVIFWAFLASAEIILTHVLRGYIAVIWACPYGITRAEHRYCCQPTCYG
jgi:hypothetical protein